MWTSLSSQNMIPFNIQTRYSSFQLTYKHETAKLELFCLTDTLNMILWLVCASEDININFFSQGTDNCWFTSNF